MSEFKWRRFEGEIILWAVRWSCRYGISYRDLEQMMGERGVLVDHSTIYRWVQRYAPEMEKRLRWQRRRPQSTSWRVDETYVKVCGNWAYLYRALDKHGNMMDVYLSPTRNAGAAKRFLSKALNGFKEWEKPEIINTDKALTYGVAISELKADGKCPEKTVHRQVKYLNIVIEADHGKLKQLIRLCCQDFRGPKMLGYERTAEPNRWYTDERFWSFLQQRLSLCAPQVNDIPHRSRAMLAPSSPYWRVSPSPHLPIRSLSNLYIGN